MGFLITMWERTTQMIPCRIVHIHKRTINVLMLEKTCENRYQLRHFITHIWYTATTCHLKRFPRSADARCKTYLQQLFTFHNLTFSKNVWWQIQQTFTASAVNTLRTPSFYKRSFKNPSADLIIAQICDAYIFPQPSFGTSLIRPYSSTFKSNPIRYIVHINYIQYCCSLFDYTNTAWSRHRSSLSG